MATDTMTNNASGSAKTLTPAQQLMERHAAEITHNPTVEDTVDEDDILHPPPSASLTDSTPQTTAPTLSEKAAGKQKAKDKASESFLNTQSEEAFPALGAPSARNQASVGSAWGKKPAIAKSAPNGVGHGVNGAAAPSNGSSRASSPASGMNTPSSTAASNMAVRSGSVPKMNIPGRHTERIEFLPSQLIPRNQLKRPVPDILRDITRRSKAKVEIKTGAMGTYIFEAQGPNQDVVQQALREVANQIGSKQSIKVAVPSSCLSHVIGKAGTTIQGIQKRSGARIQVPRTEKSAIPAEDDDSATIDIVVEGDPVAAESARREIEAIVNERTSTVNLRLRDIPPEYYPFLAGAHNSRLNNFKQDRDIEMQIPHYHTRPNQTPLPPIGEESGLQFAPQAGFPIHISGDRAAAMQARADIEREVEQLRRRLGHHQFPMDRGRHQIIFGDRSGSLHDFLEETGCTVILPPDSSDSEDLMIIGPPDRLEQAKQKLMELAANMHEATVDVARHHPNAPMGAHAHARNLSRYLQQRQAIQELERLHKARIVLPTTQNGSAAWNIYARNGMNSMRARTDIANLLNAHPPTRLRTVDIDPFFHEHLQQQAAQQIRDEFGVHVVVPTDVDDVPEVLLVYEGPMAQSDYEIPRKQPTGAEVRIFERTLQEAQEHLLGVLSGHGPIVSRELEAPQKFHDKIRRYVDKEQTSLPDGGIPVQMQIGVRRPQDLPPDVFSIRGPSNAAADLQAKILQFIEQEKQNELERGYTTSCNFPQKFANILIGKKGDNINKLREEFDVDIQVSEGNVEIKGPKAKAEACKAHIVTLGKKLEDEATHVLKIQPQYHRDLIGAGGSQVNRLQDRYNVRVNFPRSAKAGDDDQSVEDAPKRSNQQPDEVIIKGPKRGADEAREELLSLLQWTVDNSQTATVSVAQDQIPSLIGAGGREMENLRLSTGCQIDVPGARDPVSPSRRVELRLKGTKKAVQEAKRLLEQRAKTFDETVTRTIDVPKKYHRALIGSGGANIRDIVIKAGGPDDRRELARTVRFPKPDADDNTIRVEGTPALVDKIVTAIQALVNERENQVTDTIEIAPEKHRQLIGRGGETRRNLQTQFNVAIDIPRQNTTGAARSQIKLTGRPSDIESAKAHILTLVRDQEGETVLVPRALHHAISDNGQFFRRLRNEHRVTVDHGGQQPPPKPATPQLRRNTNGSGSNGALPLITDDPAASAANGGDDHVHFWDLHELHDPSASDDDNTIPWTLRGAPANIAPARAALDAALAQARQQSHAGFLVLADPRVHRVVIGPGGATINAIRKQTGTRVQVPRGAGNGGGEAIEIWGGKDGVESAKEMILEAVREAGERRGNGGRR
ncbi:MAG: hypothetical protein M1822_008542 [Bathelium mastoideum]|nr:MAG: hypothetical protein M1822_008542 [Bathelium mastoideum]